MLTTFNLLTPIWAWASLVDRFLSPTVHVLWILKSCHRPWRSHAPALPEEEEVEESVDKKDPVGEAARYLLLSNTSLLDKVACLLQASLFSPKPNLVYMLLHVIAKVRRRKLGLSSAWPCFCELL